MIRDIYVPLSVGFPRDPKVRAMVFEHGQDGILAAYLYIMMCLYCRENLTDGWVPVAEIPLLAYPLEREQAMQLASRLQEACLVGASASHRPPALQVHAFVKRNGTRQDAERVSDQRRHAARNRWDMHHVSTVHSNVHSKNDARYARVRGAETESIEDRDLSPVPAGTRATPNEGEIDLPTVVIHEVRAVTGGLVLGREQAADIAAQIIGDRQLTSPAAYVRRSIRNHPDPFALAGAPPAPDLPSTPPARRRSNGVADVPAAVAHRAASTVDGHVRAPATDEQRTAHAAAARAALAAKAAERTAAVELPDTTLPPPAPPGAVDVLLPAGSLDDDPF